jgi:hypothetical protein
MEPTMTAVLPRADQVISQFEGDLGEALRYAKEIHFGAEPLRDELIVYAWVMGWSTYRIAEELSETYPTLSHVRVFQILKARIGELSADKREQMRAELDEAA